MGAQRRARSDSAAPAQRKRQAMERPPTAKEGEGAAAEAQPAAPPPEKQPERREEDEEEDEEVKAREGEDEVARAFRERYSGRDTKGNRYESLDALWAAKLGEGARGAAPDTPEGARFYERGAEYWRGVSASVQGMLGGYGHISATDIKGSRAFLKAIGAKFGAALGKRRAAAASP
jgi:protein N-terminal methyltransferase